MPRKKKRSNVPETLPTFAEGAAVRVKAGVLHPNYPDIPLGGWAGVVNDFNGRTRPPMYEVKWSDATLSHVHPIYESRCERDDRSSGSTWLRDSDLEEDPGDEPVLEQPTELRPRPLKHDDPHDACLAVFGLTSDDEIPPVNEVTLRRYHQYLSGRLRFPDTALHLVVGRFTQPRITPVVLRGLAPVEQASIREGLLAEVLRDNRPTTLPLADLQLRPGDRSVQDLLAYRFWLASAPEELPPLPSAGAIRVTVVLIATVLGAVGGALHGAIPGTHLAAQIGATVFALLGTVAGGYTESSFRQIQKKSPSFLGGALVGMLGGAAVGAVVASVIAAFVGALLGVVAGVVVAKVLSALKLPGLKMIPAMLAGAVLGAIAYAFYRNAGAALSGGTIGGLIGAAGGAVVVVGRFVYSITVLRGDR